MKPHMHLVVISIFSCKRSLDERWECRLCIPKVGGSNPSSGVFPPKLSWPPTIICVQNLHQISVCAKAVLCGISIRRKDPWAQTAVWLLWPMIVIYHSYTPHLHTMSNDLFRTTSRWVANSSSCVHTDTPWLPDSDWQAWIPNSAAWNSRIQ